MPNQTTVYALACLKELAKFSGELLQTATIAVRGNIPLAYCQKVLYALAQAGIVTSVRGRGFALDRGLETITMAEVIAALEARSAAEEPEGLEALMREKVLGRLKGLPVTEIFAGSV